MEFITNSSQETIELGKKIGAQLKAGDILAFYGELGSGKTTMIKGVCLGLGVAEESIVKSPSFIIINEYQGVYSIYHIDLYRIKDPSELYSLGLEDYLEGSGICLIEWAEKLNPELLAQAIKVQIEIIANTMRKIKIHGLKTLN
ncbi:MAG: tRNA (adenosine(37)-N6)-threonylcarbamoyltransferase complex ATPase subunit type 1 TsaE [candidate division WOR-3 bacterium]|nr:tRNA (adenosine(37)-N6)-threonylcarbamoyltransferase complex ATPase subunit type 1 TsaE [candidate division WOR-3 bacterium]MCX7757889.1 tRNA (adenosine(37)-N6)-threonylcarbamoyltransferase complex ATPase subunit type 1 TsaE [candidate division WOR-3 bacterium]MDW7987344.1 tRNA (adenosine(37)-N6)-threonylcarbamoyltransferase complex ATPase subunit type 1 TsaE [candidate division WOR-3 bacterium]